MPSSGLYHVYTPWNISHHFSDQASPRAATLKPTCGRCVQNSLRRNVFTAIGNTKKGKFPMTDPWDWYIYLHLPSFTLKTHNQMYGIYIWLCFF